MSPFRVGFYAFAATLALRIAMAPQAVAIKVTPQVLMVNGSVQITCTVEPDDRNRQLNAGLRFYSASSRSLEGAQSAKTWRFPALAHIPCPETDDTYVAYCQVLRNDDSVVDAVARLQVAGCE